MNEFLAIVCKLFGSVAKTLWVFLSALVVAYWSAAPAAMHTIAYAAIAVYVIDTISGSILAAREKRFSSRSFGRSISKLVVYGLAVAASVPIGTVFSTVLPVVTAYALITTVLTLVFVRESSSILENLKCMGFVMPQWISERLSDVDKRCLEDPTKKLTTSDSTCVTTETEAGTETHCEVSSIEENAA